MSNRTKSYEIDMCHGPLFGKILKYSLPLIASGLLNFCYNIVNTAMLGRFSGSAAMAAVGSTGAVISLFISLFMGLSVGINVLVARAFATKNKNDLQEIVHTAVLMGLIIGVFVAVSGFFVARPLLLMTGTPKEIIKPATTYMRIYFFGFLASSVSSFSSAVLNGVGDTRRPFFFSVFNSTIHILLNLLFIVVLDMSVVGVATSTAIVQFSGAILNVSCLMRSKGDYHLDVRKLKIHKDKLKKMAFIGVPSGLQSTATGITNTIVQAAVNSFGFLVVAGNTASNNLGNLVYICIAAYHSTTLTFVSQNYGAGKIKRVLKIIRTCFTIVTVIGILLGGALYIFAEPLLKIYTSDKEAIAAGVLRIALVYLTHSLYGWTDVLAAALRGMGRSALSMIITMSGLCGFTIVWIYTVFKYSHTLATLYSVYPIAWVLTSIVYIICLTVIIKKIGKKHRI